MFVSPITQMIAAGGVAVRMQAGVARPLPDALINLALAKGVVAADGALVSGGVTDPGATLEDVVAAIRALMEAGDAKAFGATGEPKLNALKAKVGKPVTDALRDEAWAAVKTEV